MIGCVNLKRMSNSDVISKFFALLVEVIQIFTAFRMVDNDILTILRQRFEDCVFYEAPDHMTKCKEIQNYLLKAEENWFTKCE